MTTTITATSLPGAAAADSLRDTATLTGCILQHWKRRPVSILLGLLFPVLMVLMFGYLFGGAMAVPDGHYMDFLIPCMLAMSMLFGLEAMVVAVTTDTAKGVTERIRAMPVTTTAILASRSAADFLSAFRHRRHGRDRAPGMAAVRVHLDRHLSRAATDNPGVGCRRADPCLASRIPFQRPRVD
jgi:hypothetical protein